jgi:hypothetical protein
VARQTYPQFTEAEIDRIVEKSKPYYVGNLMVNRPPFYGQLDSKTIAIHFDNGISLTYAFKNAHTLVWKHSESDQLNEEYYEALQADQNVVLIAHIIQGSRPQRARMIVWETDTNLVTAFFAKIGNEFSTREVDRDIVFGYVDCGNDVPRKRHCLTEDLVGRSIIWTYSPEFTIQHIYASKCYSAFVNFTTYYGGMLRDAPCNYVKINDHVYIYSWVETEGSGVQGLALMNLHTLHDVGCFFGINGESRFEFYTFGAVGEYAGQLTNLNIPNDTGMDYPRPHVIPQEEGKCE